MFAEFDGLPDELGFEDELDLLQDLDAQYGSADIDLVPDSPIINTKMDSLIVKP